MSGSGIAKKILSDLIAIDTSNPPGNELDACNYMKSLFNEYGIKCEIQNLGSNRGNIIATIGDPSGKKLLFNGHLDVVPAQTEMWTVPPFKMTEKGNRLYGRGSSDMKSGIAAMTAAAIELVKEKYEFQGLLQLVFVTDEECSNLGTKAYLENYTNYADYGVISEPTDLTIYTSHKGVGRYFIDFLGKPHHSSIVSNEYSSIQQAARGIIAIEKLNNRLQEEKCDDMTPPSVQVTMMDAYEKDNIIPAKARLLVDYRITPGFTEEELKNNISEALNAYNLNYSIVPHFFLNAGKISSDNPFVQRFAGVIQRCIGKPSEISSMQGSSEQVLFLEKGIQTVLCGPGSFEQCHCIDEYMETEQLHMAVDIYKELIKTIL